MKQPLLAAALALVLAACATPGPKTGSPAIQDPRARIVDTAQAMVGQPYRFGGAAPGGFDCSGLVVYSAGSAGLKLPRTAREQLHAGKAIARRDLEAGDLVFMHLKHKELHVGIAIDGNHFVHAPAGGGRVRIDSLARPAYARGFIEARRIVYDAGPKP